MDKELIRARKKEKGVILLVTLWIAIVLSLIAYSLSYQVRLEMKLTKLFRQRAQATALARAGIAKAVADLKNDLIIDTSEGGERFDAEGDIWASPEDKTDAELGPGTFTTLVIDEDSRINLNTARFEVLKELLITLGLDEDEAVEIAFAIIDWRDADEGLAIGKGERENVYYSELIREANNDSQNNKEKGIIYRCKNDNFTTVEELLEVYGITPELFYGYDPEKRLEEELTLRSNSEKEEKQKPGLRDFLTVHNDARVNINTAPQEVLTAITAAAGVGGTDPEGLAEAIINYRRNNRQKDFDNKQAFRNWHDLAQVEGFNPNMVRQIYSFQPLTTSSNTFRIISTGRVGEVTQTLTLIVDRTLEHFNLEEDKAEKRGRRWSTGSITRASAKESILREPTIRVINWIQP